VTWEKPALWSACVPARPSSACPRLSDRGLSLEAGDGVTTLSGVLHDQAQLYGVLERIPDPVSNSPESMKTSQMTAECIGVRRRAN
jgi:hypothetical protein